MKKYLNPPLFTIGVILLCFYILSGCKNDPLTPEKAFDIDEKESAIPSMDVLSVEPDISTITVTQDPEDTTEVSLTLDPGNVEFSIQSTNKDIDLYNYQIHYFDPYGNMLNQSQYSYVGSVTKKIQVEESSDSSSTDSEPVKDESVKISVFSHKIIQYATNNGSLDFTTHISPITASIKIWANDENGVPLADTGHCTLVTAVETN